MCRVQLAHTHIIDPALDALLPWYRTNKRALPWRHSPDPYRVWISEAMLQQTTVATAIPYFHRWLERFPNVESLANACERDVLRVWEGLGYYRRAKCLLSGAKWLVANGWPRSAEEWQAVPGVGPYTAGAIASIGLGQATALVDGNVERVYARLTGDESTGGRLRRNAWAWAADEVRTQDPGDWNQALMELGAKICRPLRPKCPICPLHGRCEARRLGNFDRIPSPKLRKTMIDVHFAVWAPILDGMLGVRRSRDGSWWEGLWEFPRDEVAAPGSYRSRVLQDMFGTRSDPLPIVRHIVTHHRITLHPARVELSAPVDDLIFVSAGGLADLPMPRHQRKIAEMAMAYGERNG